MNVSAKIDQVAMARMWLGGVRTTDIAAFFGCRMPAVSRCARALNLPKRDPSGQLLDTPRDQTDSKRRYLAKPIELPPVKPKLLHTYATVQELVALGMTQTQALCEFHRRRA